MKDKLVFLQLIQAATSTEVFIEILDLSHLSGICKVVNKRICEQQKMY